MQTAGGVKRIRTPSGWIDDGVTPITYGATKLGEARRGQAFRDSNLFRRNLLPADGLARGQMPRALPTIPAVGPSRLHRHAMT